ncbi:hypothetical protein DSO57_1012168 [Entomophthora muscae]|uniref:Uncharacterized protein n=1 Tax=Entomophthora muscae TaxID=34485 RepID=A0ACC2SV77_9FUNG|nr:hypothetical protein DSO57_1012168 [Entomophthora muscae]
MADILYDKLMEDRYLWEEKLAERHKDLKKLAVDTKVSKGQLLKLFGDSWLLYICPSLHMDSVVAAHKTTGQGGIQKTLAMLQQHCFWEGMHMDVVETLAFCHDCNIKHLKVTVTDPGLTSQTYRYLALDSCYWYLPVTKL